MIPLPDCYCLLSSITGRVLAQDIAEREARRKAEHGTFVEPSAAKETADQKKLQVMHT